MSGVDYRQLRQQVSMTRVLGLIGFRATQRHGPQLRGRCPICHSPCTFSAHLSRQIYHCFACRSHGNALDLWAAVRGQSLYQAAIDLCHTIGLVMPASPAPSAYPMPPSQRTSEVAVRVPQRNR
jgi:DNA primase